MSYFIWLYAANLSNRFRWIGQNIFRISLIALALEHLALAQHQRPIYYDQMMHYINITWLWMILSWIIILLPSDKFIRNVLTMYKRDGYLRDSLIAKILRLVKFTIKYDLFNMEYSKGIYQKVVTPKRIKWLCILMYLYDLYVGYKRAVADIVYFIVAYFGFACASWFYVYLTGSQIYYYHTIVESFDWGIAIIGFLIFKVLFIPSFSTIFSIGLRILGKVVYYKFGVAGMGDKIDRKLAQYVPPTEDKING